MSKFVKNKEIFEIKRILNEKRKEIKRKSNESQERSENLKKRCLNRLKKSKFRAINEFLSSHSSSEAMDFITEDNFKEYHKTYKELSEKWPKKPINYVIKRLKGIIENTCESHDIIDIADIGCGDVAQIARAFKQNNKTRVHSFDLIENPSEHVLRADMTSLPLNQNSMDFCVFSLSLMPKDLTRVLLECHRVLKPEARVLIVEVTSRFEGREEEFAREVSVLGLLLKGREHVDKEGFFTCFEFEKRRVRGKGRQGMPEIRLKPVFYKTR